MLSRCIDRALFILNRHMHFTVVLPNANTLANHICYSVTVDIPNLALLQDVENEWVINITDTHASDE